MMLLQPSWIVSPVLSEATTGALSHLQSHVEAGVP